MMTKVYEFNIFNSSMTKVYEFDIFNSSMTKVYEFDIFNSSMLHMPPTSRQFPATYQDLCKSLSVNKKYGRISVEKSLENEHTHTHTNKEREKPRNKEENVTENQQDYVEE